MSHLFAFAIGLLKPRLDPQNRTTPIYRAADNKLLDLQVLRVIRSYIDTPFYFTSKDVEVHHRVIIENVTDKCNWWTPYHICELLDGCIAVAAKCRNNGLIRIFRNNKIVQEIKNDVVVYPFGICTNSKNQLIVTDVDKHQVHMFNRDGSHVLSFGSEGRGDGQLKCPYDVCVNSKGHIIVADSWNGRISMFSCDGTFIRSFGSKGTNGGQLKYPIGIHVDRCDNIYVVEEGNHRVSKFSSSGEFIRTFGSEGGKPGHLCYPYDIKVDPDGKYIVVADTGNERIQVLSGLDGSFIASYGSGSYEDIQFISVTSCVITTDGRILVSDNSERLIHEIYKA